MNQLLLILSTCLVLAASLPSNLAVPAGGEKDDVSNTIIDDVLAKVDEAIVEAGLDPATLKDEAVELEFNVAFITVTASATLTKGFLSGLSSLHRTGESNSTTLNGTNIVGAEVSFDDLAGGYKMHVEAMGWGRDGKVDITIREIVVDIEIKQCEQTGCNAELTKFDVVKIGWIDVEVQGFGAPGNAIVEGIVEGITNIMRICIANMIEGPLGDLIKSVLDNIPPIA